MSISVKDIRKKAELNIIRNAKSKQNIGWNHALKYIMDYIDSEENKE